MNLASYSESTYQQKGRLSRAAEEKRALFRGLHVAAGRRVGYNRASVLSSTGYAICQGD
jgi:hypothetical protein